MAILFVTHFLDQVYEISDRITVLRNGQFVGEYACARARRACALVAAMVGREPARSRRCERRGRVERRQRRQPDSARAARARPFAARQRDGRRHRDPAGEILGLAGLLGSGRTEVARLLFGLDRADAGEIHIDGQPATLDDPAEAMRTGRFCPEDRKTAASSRISRSATTSC